MTEIVWPAEPKILTTFSKSSAALTCPLHCPTNVLPLLSNIDSTAEFPLSLKTDKGEE